MLTTIKNTAMTLKDLKDFIKDLPDDTLVLTSGLKSDELTDIQATKIKVTIKGHTDLFGSCIYEEANEKTPASDTIADAILIDLNCCL